MTFITVWYKWTAFSYLIDSYIIIYMFLRIPYEILIEKSANMPHIARASLDLRKRLIKIISENIKCFIDGNPQNIVN